MTIISLKTLPQRPIYLKYQGVNNAIGGSFSVQSHLAWVEMILLI